MKSKTALFKALKTSFGRDLNLKSKGVSNETYGKTSCIYLWEPEQLLGVTRSELQTWLRNQGFKFNPRYEPNAVEVTVSYFKGWHWDE